MTKSDGLLSHCVYGHLRIDIISMEKIPFYECDDICSHTFSPRDYL